MFTRRGLFAALFLVVAATSATGERPSFVPSSKISPSSLIQSKNDLVVEDISRGGAKQVVKSTPFVSKSASVLMGFILALNSGLINGCALSGAISANGQAQAVAAVTASWTNSAMGLASGDKGKFGFLAKIIVSFMGGSFIAGYLQPNPSQFLVSSSSFGLPLLIAAGAMLVAKSFLDDTSSVKLGLCILALANGINNSVTSTMTSNLCRTSHFTGITSDMGTFLGQILRGNKANVFKLKVFAGLAACFWTGGYLSYGLAKAHGSSILYLPAAVYLFMALGYDKFAKGIF